MTPSRTAGTPRARARAALTAEIKQVARRQLVEIGATGLSLRAVARELGLGSASALYRYFSSRDALLTELIVDSYSALGAAAESAEEAVHQYPVLVRWLAICHGVRDWSLTNRSEYTLIFGTPIPGYAAPADTAAPATRVPTLLSSLLADVAADPSVARGATVLGPAARRALEPVLVGMPSRVTPGLAARGLMAWTYLFGAISFEVFGHRHDVIADPAAFFDYEMREIAVSLNITGPAGSQLHRPRNRPRER